MKRLTLHLILFPLVITALGCGTAATSGRPEPTDPGSRPGMPPTVATLASEFELMCDDSPPCGAERLTGEDRAECLATAREMASAPCATEAQASLRCGKVLVVCTPTGEVDPDATFAALEASCAAETDAVSACCEQHPESPICETGDGGEVEPPAAAPAE